MGKQSPEPGATIPGTEDGTPGVVAPALPELPTIDPEHYALQGELARGGLGRILRARDRFLDRSVALKEALRGDDAATARFIREALVTARLQHPSIVPVYEAGRWPTGEAFYAMKLVSGRALTEVIEESKTLDERIALLPNVIAVADAIAYAHGEGIIHRDLKPDNVLVGKFGETVVIDWGLAKDLSMIDGPVEGPYEIAASDLTVAGAVMGTPAYMAPEQASGGVVDERTDVYAIGGLLYHVLTGEPPRNGKSKEEILVQLKVRTPVDVEARAPGTPRDLATIVKKALAFEPDDRYPTAKELADDLKRFQTGQLVSSRSYTTWQLALRWIRRHRTPLAITAAAALLLAITGVYAVTNVVRERNRAQTAQQTAEARTHELILVQARSALDRDPAAALAWLKTYPLDGPNWAEGHEIALEAEALGPSLHILDHPGAMQIAWSPDGKLIASGGRSGEIRIWDVAAGKVASTIRVPGDVLMIRFAPVGGSIAFAIANKVYLAPISGTPREVVLHDSAIQQLAFSADGTQIASVSSDGKLMTFDGTTARVHLSVKGILNCVAFSPTRPQVAAGGEDGVVRVVDLASDSTMELRGHTGAVYSVAFAPDGSQLASGSVDNTVRLWPVAGGEPMILSGHVDGDPIRVRFGRDGKRLLSEDTDFAIVWDARTGQQLGKAPERFPSAVTPDFTMVARGGDGGQLDLEDLATGAVQPLRGYTANVLQLAFSPTGDRLATLGGGSLRVWVFDQRSSHQLVGHESWVNGIAFTPDGRTVVTSSTDKTLRVFDVMTGITRRVFAGHTAPLVNLAIAPDGRSVASASTDRTARVWDLETGAARVLTGHEGALRAIAYARDSRAIYTAAEDGTIRIWNLGDGSVRVLADHRGVVNSIDVSPDGRLLVSAGDDGGVRVWNLASSAMRELGHHEGAAGDARFLPDGRRVISLADPSSSTDHTVRVWDLDRGTNQIVLARAGLWSVAVAPDGRRVAIGGLDGVIRIIELASGAVRELRGHSALVSTLAFSPDGTLLASGASDKTARLWVVSTGASRIAHRHAGELYAVAFSSLGNWMASASRDQTAWVGPVDPASCLQADASAVMARIRELTTAVITDDRAVSQ